MLFNIVFCTNQRRRIPCSLVTLRDNQRDRLAVEKNMTGVERTERVARRRHLVAPATIQSSNFCAFFMGENLDDAGHGTRAINIEASKMSRGDRAGHDHTVQHLMRGIFRCIFGLAGDLQTTVDAAGGTANMVQLGGFRRNWQSGLLS